MPADPTPALSAAAPALLPAEPPPAAAPAAADLPVHQLTPEEQMALFAKELKETDWGHQPC